MLALLGLSIVLACAACFGLGWFARGEREAVRVRDAAATILGASQAATAQATQEKAEVAAETVELAAEDNLGQLLAEEVARKPSI